MRMQTASIVVRFAVITLALAFLAARPPHDTNRDRQSAEPVTPLSGTWGLPPVDRQVGLTGSILALDRDEAGRPRYLVLAELGDFESDAQSQGFIDELDRRLMAINFLVNYRRREGVLDAPRLTLIETGSWSRYIQREGDRRGTGDFQYKLPGIVHDSAGTRQFTTIRQLDSRVLPR